MGGLIVLALIVGGAAQFVIWLKKDDAFLCNRNDRTKSTTDDRWIAPMDVDYNPFDVDVFKKNLPFD